MSFHILELIYYLASLSVTYTSSHRLVLSYQIKWVFLLMLVDFTHKTGLKQLQTLVIYLFAKHM